jgi:hypothetical protein
MGHCSLDIDTPEIAKEYKSYTPYRGSSEKKEAPIYGSERIFPITEIRTETILRSG